MHLQMSQLRMFLGHPMGLLQESDMQNAGCTCAGNADNVSPPPTSKVTASYRS